MASLLYPQQLGLEHPDTVRIHLFTQSRMKGVYKLYTLR